MSTTGRDRYRMSGIRVAIIACLMLCLVTPVSSRTDSTVTGLSTKEKLLRLLKDSSAAVPRSPAAIPAARPASPAPAPPQGGEETDRSLSPVADKNEIASSRTGEASRARENTASAPVVTSPPAGGPPAASPAVSGGNAIPGSGDTSPLWWQVPVACLLLATAVFIGFRNRAMVARLMAGVRHRTGLNSIRGKLIFVTLSLVLCAVGITGYIAYDRGAASLVSGLQQNFQGLAVTIMDKIDRGLAERYEDVRASAGDPIVSSALTGKGSPESLRAFVTAKARAHGNAAVVIVADRNGKVIAAAASDQNRTLHLEGTSVAGEPWFSACTAGQGKAAAVYTGEPGRYGVTERALGSKIMTMPFVAPVRDRAGAIVGVWCSQIDFAAAVQQVNDEAITYQRGNGFPSFRITMIDRKGLILDDDAEKDVLVKNLASSGNSQCVSRVLAGESGSTVEKSVRFGYTQVNGFAASHGSGAYPGDRWGLLVRAKTDDVLAPVIGLRNTVLLLGILIGLVSIVAVVLYSRRIIAPLRDLAGVADRLATGDVNVTVDVTSEDEVGRLAASVSTLISTMHAQASVVERIAEGDLAVSVTPRSPNDVVTVALGKAVQALRDLTGEIEALSHAAIEGRLSTRGDTGRFQGVYSEIVAGINGTLDAVIGPLTVAATTVDRIARGDIPPRITDTYRGDFHVLTDNLNQAIDAVNALVADAHMLSRAAVEGNVTARADAGRHGGEFRTIVKGVNATLDSLVGFIDIIPLPVMVIDRERTIQYINGAGAAVGGKQPAQLIGSKCHDHFRTSHCATGDCAVLRAMATGKQEQGETVACPAADELAIRYTGMPIRNEEGVTVGALGIVVDETAIKHAQVIADKVAAYQKVQVEMLADDLKKLAAGDLDLHLMVAPGDADTADVKHDFETINTRLDAVRLAVANLVADAHMLSEAAVAGQLATRADTTRHQGEFHRIVKGVNATLDAVITPVQEGAKTLAVMATGDLTVRMQGAYQGDLQLIKENINRVGTSLQSTLRNVAEAITATASASSAISASTEEMAAGAFEQTSQTGEVASAVEEMTQTILENARNANVAADTARKARVSAEQGGAVVGESVQGMKRIAEVVHRSANTVRELGRSSDQIGEIIGVIEDIADQTNLLALNAAIEAARAGDQGRGFAVVADEVRKLAERTTKATKEITGMIKKIQSDTTGAVKAMEEGTSEVEQGIVLADKAGASLQEIVEVSQKVTDMVTQIATASEQQSATSAQISRNVEAISKVTEEAAEGTQQISRTGEDLNRLTETLQRLIAAFSLNGEGRPERHGGSLDRVEREAPSIIQG